MLQLVSSGLPFQYGSISSGAALPLTLQITPSTNGSLTQVMQFLISGAKPSLAARFHINAIQQGTNCEQCTLVLGGSAYSNGAQVPTFIGPAGTTSIVNGLITNNANVSASWQLFVYGPQGSDYALGETNGSPLSTAAITLAPGASKAFLLIIYYPSGVAQATLAITQAHLTSTVIMSVQLSAQGQGQIPPVPGFSACDTAKYHYCIFVGNDLVDGLPINSSVPPLNPPGTNYAYNFGQLTLNNWVGVPINIINNDPSNITAGFVNPAGPLRMFTVATNGTRTPLPIDGSGTPNVTVTAAARIATLEAQYAWQPAAGGASTAFNQATPQNHAGFAQIQARFSPSTQTIPLMFMSNCGYSACVFWDNVSSSELQRGPLGYDNFTKAAEHHQLVIGNPLITITDTFTLSFLGFTDLNHPPSGATPLTFDYNNSATIGPITVPPKRVVALNYSLVMPSTSSTSAAALNLTLSQPDQGTVFNGPYDYARITSSPNPNPFPNCPNICVYRRQTESSASPFWLFDNTTQLVSLNGPTVSASFSAGEGQVSTGAADWLIVNNTNNTVPLSAVIDPLTPTYAFEPFVLGTSLGWNAANPGMTFDQYWLPPHSAQPLAISVFGEHWNTSTTLHLTAAGYGQMSINLSNTIARVNADCTTLCIRANGAVVPNGDSLIVPTSRVGGSSNTSTQMFTVVNGLSTDGDFEVALTDGSGIALDASSGLSFSAGCNASISTPTICRGHLTGGTSIDLTLRSNGTGAIGFQVVTTLGSYEHTMNATACNGLCAYANNVLVGARSPAIPLDFGRTVTGHSRSLVLTIINNSNADAHLGSATIEGPVTSFGPTFALAGTIPADLTVSAQSAWQATVAFQPSARGSYTGSVLFSANAAAKVPLSGTAHMRMAVPVKTKSGKVVMIKN